MIRQIYKNYNTNMQNVIDMVKALRENQVMDVYEPKAKPGNPLDMVMGLFKW